MSLKRKSEKACQSVPLSKVVLGVFNSDNEEETGTWETLSSGCALGTFPRANNTWSDPLHASQRPQLAAAPGSQGRRSMILCSMLGCELQVLWPECISHLQSVRRMLHLSRGHQVTNKKHRSSPQGGPLSLTHKLSSPAGVPVVVKAGWHPDGTKAHCP